MLYYLKVYGGLRGSRRVGPAGGLPIPVSEILAYCELFYIQKLQERERIFHHVAALDACFLKHVNDRAQASQPK